MEGLALLILEAGVALGLLVFIVWWTWPRRRTPAEDEGDPSARRLGEEKKQDGD